MVNRESRDAPGDRGHGDLPQDVRPRLLRRRLLPEKASLARPAPFGAGWAAGRLKADLLCACAVRCVRLLRRVPSCVVF